MSAAEATQCVAFSWQPWKTKTMCFFTDWISNSRHCAPISKDFARAQISPKQLRVPQIDESTRMAGPGGR